MVSIIEPLCHGTERSRMCQELLLCQLLQDDIELAYEQETPRDY